MPPPPLSSSWRPGPLSSILSQALVSFSLAGRGHRDVTVTPPPPSPHSPSNPHPPLLPSAATTTAIVVTGTPPPTPHPPPPPLFNSFFFSFFFSLSFFLSFFFKTRGHPLPTLPHSWLPWMHTQAGPLFFCTVSGERKSGTRKCRGGRRSGPPGSVGLSPLLIVCLPLLLSLLLLSLFVVVVFKPRNLIQSVNLCHRYSLNGLIIMDLQLLVAIMDLHCCSGCCCCCDICAVGDEMELAMGSFPC